MIEFKALFVTPDEALEVRNMRGFVSVWCYEPWMQIFQNEIGAIMRQTKNTKTYRDKSGLFVTSSLRVVKRIFVVNE